MAYKTWADGDVLTAADVMTYLMRQSVIVCTSASRPTSPAEGMTIYETDTDRMYHWTGSSWTNRLDSNTGLVAGSGFTVSSFSGRRSPWGVCCVTVTLTCTSTITVGTGGNIAGDPTMCTIPSAYRPLDNICAPFGNGVVSGEAMVGTDGAVSLRAATGDVASGTTVRCSAAYII